MWISTEGYQALHLPSSPRSPLPMSRGPARLAAGAVALSGLLTLMSLYNLSDGASISEMLRPSSSPACNPYAQPGRLAYDGNDAHANRWHPFAEAASDAVGDECTQPAPALAAAFLRASWTGAKPSKHTNVGSEWAQAERGPDGREWEDVEWARNRTILYLGDSISRYKADYLCQMAGEELIELNWKHPWSPPRIYRNASEQALAGSQDLAKEPSRDPLDPFGWHRIPPGEAHTHIGHYCYVPGLDFLLVHLHSYGLDEEEYYADRDTYYPPYTFEERVQKLAGPWIDHVRATTGRTAAAPELIYLNSAMWDVMRWANKDLEVEASQSSSLGRQRLGWYRRRVREAIMSAATQFPDASLMWSSTHYPIRPSTGWFFPGVAPHKRPELKLLRLREMHEAAVSAFTDTRDLHPNERRLFDGVQMNRWGLAMMGQEEHQVDDLHPEFLPGGYLWVDMALYDLRSVITGLGL